jgi:hypothetical protein
VSYSSLWSLQIFSKGVYRVLLITEKCSGTEAPQMKVKSKFKISNKTGNKNKGKMKIKDKRIVNVIEQSLVPA